MSRLVQSQGNYFGDSVEGQSNGLNYKSDYTLNMAYDEAGVIMKKVQNHTIDGVLERKNSYDGYYKRVNGSHRIQEIDRGNRGGLLNFSYDLGGRMTKIIQPQTGDTTFYFWDGSGFLRGVYRKGYLSYSQYSLHLIYHTDAIHDEHISIVHKFD